MDNDEMIVMIKDMFEQSMERMESKFSAKIDEVKNHMGVIAEDLRGDIKAIAEGHEILNSKFDRIEIKVDGLDNRLGIVKLEVKGLKKDVRGLKTDVKGLKTDVKGLKADVDGLKADVKGLKSDMVVVKECVIGVEAKLNEHEIIL